MRNGPMPLFQFLSRLPAALWLRGIAALLLIVVLATFGLALLAGVAALVVLAVLGFKLRDYFARLFAGRTKNQQPGRDVRIVDAEYVIIDRRDRR